MIVGDFVNEPVIVCLRQGQAVIIKATCRGNELNPIAEVLFEFLPVHDTPTLLLNMCAVRSPWHTPEKRDGLTRSGPVGQRVSPFGSALRTMEGQPVPALALPS